MSNKALGEVGLIWLCLVVVVYMVLMASCAPSASVSVGSPPQKGVWHRVGDELDEIIVDDFTRCYRRGGYLSCVRR